MTDLSALATLRSRRCSTLSSDRISVAEPVMLGRFPSLRVHDPTVNALSSLAGLEGRHPLRSSNVYGNETSDLGALGSPQQLRVLDVSGNRILSLAPLVLLRGLAVLVADGNRIADTSAVAGLTSIHGANVAHSNPRAVAWLSESLGPGDAVDLRWNLLDPSPGGDAARQVRRLLDAGVKVDRHPKHSSRQ